MWNSSLKFNKDKTNPVTFTGAALVLCFYGIRCGHSGNSFGSSFAALCKDSNFCIFSRRNPCYRESILAADVEEKKATVGVGELKPFWKQAGAEHVPICNCGFLSLEKSFSLRNNLTLALPVPLPHLPRSCAFKCHTREGRGAGQGVTSSFLSCGGWVQGRGRPVHKAM